MVEDIYLAQFAECSKLSRSPPYFCPLYTSFILKANKKAATFLAVFCLRYISIYLDLSYDTEPAEKLMQLSVTQTAATVAPQNLKCQGKENLYPKCKSLLISDDKV